MLKLRVSCKMWGSFKDTQWMHCRALQWMKAPSMNPSCAAPVSQWGGKREKGRILASSNRYTLGFPLLPTPDQPLIKTSRESGVNLTLLLPPHTPLPLFSSAQVPSHKNRFCEHIFAALAQRQISGGWENHCNNPNNCKQASQILGYSWCSKLDIPFSILMPKY